RQVALHSTRGPARHVSAEEVMGGRVSANELVTWAMSARGLPLVYTSSDPAVVAEAQGKYGVERIAGSIEALFAETARLLVEAGVTRLITAGGETSGAVVEGLGLSELAF